MQRILCLDIGDKRTGVAVSDPLGITAQSVETIFTKGRDKDAARVAELAEKYQTRRILCGLPRRLSGEEGLQAAKVREFAAVLAEKGFEVRFMDERLTSVSAERVLIGAGVRRDSRKNVIDKLAAAFILQDYLDMGGWKEASQADSGNQEVQ